MLGCLSFNTMPKSLKERFFDKVDITPCCWLWTATKTAFGYGQIGVNGSRTDGAHRVSWKLHVGPIPSGMWVLHKCDNPSCVNPEHLFLGTHKDNMVDCKEKGRTNGGRYCGPRKLSLSDVSAIRELDIAGVERAEIARRFGIRYRHVWRICTHRSHTTENINYFLQLKPENTTTAPKCRL